MPISLYCTVYGILYIWVYCNGLQYIAAALCIYSLLYILCLHNAPHHPSPQWLRTEAFSIRCFTHFQLFEGLRFRRVTVCIVVYLISRYRMYKLSDTLPWYGRYRTGRHRTGRYRYTYVTMDISLLERLATFPSWAGMSVIPAQGEFGKWHPGWGRECR
jgi:hypothetical protein